MNQILTQGHLKDWNIEGLVWKAVPEVAGYV